LLRDWDGLLAYQDAEQANQGDQGRSRRTDVERL
jgi:hypothetical protein